MGEVAERAVNEEKMEKKLKEISKNWGDFEFNQKPYARVEGIILMDIDEEKYATFPHLCPSI